MKTTIRLSSIITILEQAGQEILLPAFHTAVHASTKSDGSIVTQTDLTLQEYIQEELEGLDANIPFLGEEMTENEQLSCLKQSKGSYWCLDPLDGTSNFAATLPCFAISLALIHHGIVQLACIHDPVRGETFSAERGCGARLNGLPISVSDELNIGNAIGYIDFKRLDVDTATALITTKQYRSQRNIGSCALEWAWLAAGRGQFIIHGAEKIWDFAAGSLIAQEAGASVGNFSGQALFPCLALSSPVLATCTPSIQSVLQQQLILHKQ